MTIYKIGSLKVPRYKYQVLDFAQRLHESTTGISDSLPPNEGLFIYEFLRARINDWNKSPSFSKDYDDAIRQLLVAAIFEYEKSDRSSDKQWMFINGKELELI